MISRSYKDVEGLIWLAEFHTLQTMPIFNDKYKNIMQAAIQILGTRRQINRKKNVYFASCKHWTKYTLRCIAIKIRIRKMKGKIQKEKRESL